VRKSGGTPPALARAFGETTTGGAQAGERQGEGRTGRSDPTKAKLRRGAPGDPTEAELRRRRGAGRGVMLLPLCRQLLLVGWHHFELVDER